MFLWFALWVAIFLLSLVGITGQSSDAWYIGTSLWFAFIALFGPIPIGEWD
jgi:hypothetical protein